MFIYCRLNIYFHQHHQYNLYRIFLGINNFKAVFLSPFHWLCYNQILNACRCPNSKSVWQSLWIFPRDLWKDSNSVSLKERGFFPMTSCLLVKMHLLYLLHHQCFIELEALLEPSKFPMNLRPKIWIYILVLLYTSIFLLKISFLHLQNRVNFVKFIKTLETRRAIIRKL